MTTPWTAYDVVVRAHRNELLSSVPTGRRGRGRAAGQPIRMIVRRHPARPVAAG
jgi:hypothetical protein